jgi:hypothetical protein
MTIFCYSKLLRKGETKKINNIFFHYCPVNFNKIPRFAQNDKAFVVFAVGRGWVGGNAANPAPTNSFLILNSLSF